MPTQIRRTCDTTNGLALQKCHADNLSCFWILGTFSNVYLAKMKAFPDQLCALKHIIPTSGPTRIENELKCLQFIG